MPTIYRVLIDDQDDADRALPVGAAGAVITDHKEHGMLVSQYLALRKHDKWIPMRHPIEGYDLQLNGETFSSATRKGLLWGLDPHICTRCGNIVYIPEMKTYVPCGCLFPILAGVIIGSIGFTSNQHIDKVIANGFIGMMTMALLVFGISEFVTRIRFSGTQSALLPILCEKCGSQNHQSISSLAGKTMELGNGKSAHVSFAGKS